jgi:peptide/nickel transport system permease protein
LAIFFLIIRGEIMIKLIIKRIIQAIPMLLFVSIVSFMLIQLAPGDPVEAFVTPKMSPADIERIRHNMGLDKPIIIQYFMWIKNIFKGDFGYSYINHRPVLDQIMERLPATVGLGGASLMVALIVSIPLGLIAGVNKNKFIDNVLNIISYIGISIPSFWFAMMLIYIFSLKLNLLPSMGMHTIGVNSFGDIIKHGIMPCIVLSFGNISEIMRYIRSNTISQLGEEYVTIQYAFGSNKTKILFNHILKNVLLPVITILGMSLPQLVAGAFITETVFGWPGMGRLGINAIFSFDYPIIMAITMISSLLLIVGNLIADILYGFVDPRIRDLG